MSWKPISLYLPHDSIVWETQSKGKRASMPRAKERECKIALMSAKINGKQFRSVEAIMNGWGE